MCVCVGGVKEVPVHFLLICVSVGGGGRRYSTISFDSPKNLQSPRSRPRPLSRVIRIF